MRLVTRKFNRPTYFPTIWNELFADDFFVKRPAKYSKAYNKACRVQDYNAPAVNINNREHHYLIEVAAPGFKKSDFSVELDKGILTISAKKEAEKEAEEKVEGKYTHKEFSHSEFKRTFRVAEDTIDVERIEASYEAGVLVVSLPKKEQEETKLKINIL